MDVCGFRVAIVYKWKNHFMEVMSSHEKEREQEDASTKDLAITPSLATCLFCSKSCYK